MGLSVSLMWARIRFAWGNNEHTICNVFEKRLPPAGHRTLRAAAVANVSYGHMRGWRTALLRNLCHGERDGFDALCVNEVAVLVAVGIC